MTTTDHTNTNINQARSLLSLDIIHDAEQHHPLSPRVMAAFWNPALDWFAMSRPDMAASIPRSHGTLGQYRDAMTAHAMWERAGKARVRMAPDYQADLLARAKDTAPLPVLGNNLVLTPRGTSGAVVKASFGTAADRVDHFQAMDPSERAVEAGVRSHDELLLFTVALTYLTPEYAAMSLTIMKHFDVERGRADLTLEPLAEVSGYAPKSIKMHFLGWLRTQGVLKPTCYNDGTLNVVLTAAGAADLETFVATRPA